jgi:hypothetical protein
MPYVEKSALAKAYQFHRAAGLGKYRGFAVCAPVALERARADVAAGKARYPFVADSGRPWGGVSWQPAEPIGNLPFPQYAKRGLAHVDNPESHGFRLVGEVTADTPSRDIWARSGQHGGWFTDPYGDVFRDGTGLCWGVVYQLPGRKGAARFVAGYEFGGTDGGPTLDLGRVYVEPAPGDAWNTDPKDTDAARDAARAADSMAQGAAERERTYQTAWQAGQRWAELGDDIRETGKALNAMVRECRKARALAAQFPAMRAAVAARYADLLDDIREARAKRAKLARGDWDSLYFYPDDETKPAFCEAAGITEYPN